jgi:putative Ca2+/H+ antiporter (TMEM165/GDT1 family)
MATFAYASAGMTVEARESATTLEEMAESPSWINVSHVANGMISLVENNPSEAMTELSAADPDDMFCRILIAETYREMGNKTEADALRTDVLADRRINLFSAGQAIAHVRAAKF